MMQKWFAEVDEVLWVLEPALHVLFELAEREDGTGTGPWRHRWFHRVAHLRLISERLVVSDARFLHRPRRAPD